MRLACWFWRRAKTDFTFGSDRMKNDAKEKGAIAERARQHARCVRYLDLNFSRERLER